MVALSQIAEFVREETGYQGDLAEDTSLQEQIGVYGDDLAAFMERYAQKFRVDLSGYLWYFHTGDEGLGNLGGVFFPPPSCRVKNIPITLGLLRTSAEYRKWTVVYPEHRLPPRRYDLALNALAFGSIIALIVYFVARRLVD